MRVFIFVFLALLVSSPHIAAQEDPWDDEEWGDDEWSTQERSSQWTGFVEGAFGTRFERDRQLSRRQTLADLRWRVKTELSGEHVVVGFQGDLWYDGYLEEFDADLRELTTSFSIANDLDISVGRQVMTWGTGDLLFLNDLFPKDWVSFFSGRETEYLKAPSNAMRATWYDQFVNIDVAWTPVFEPDKYLTGERFSFFSPQAGDRVAPIPPLSAIEPDHDVENGEIAVRFFKTLADSEIAVYLYRGFHPQPIALNAQQKPTFSELSSIGASLRRSLGPGLFNFEAVQYLSRDDRSGQDPRIPNDQLRLLLGYEWEARKSFTVAFQYYLEWTQDYRELLENSAAANFEPDEWRHVVTNRLTYRLSQDKLTLSLFSFFSPSDSDYYLRPAIGYRYSDQWSYTFGANIFGGDDTHTFFNQFADNSNAYFRIRFNY